MGDRPLDGGRSGDTFYDSCEAASVPSGLAHNFIWTIVFYVKVKLFIIRPANVHLYVRICFV